MSSVVLGGTGQFEGVTHDSCSPVSCFTGRVQQLRTVEVDPRKALRDTLHTRIHEQSILELTVIIFVFRVPSEVLVLS